VERVRIHPLLKPVYALPAAEVHLARLKIIGRAEVRNGASRRLARSGVGERGAPRSGRMRALRHLPRGPLRPAGRGRSTPWTIRLPLAHFCPRRLAARQQPLVPLSLPQPSGHGRQVVGEGQLYRFPSMAATILPQRPCQAAPRRKLGATLKKPSYQCLLFAKPAHEHEHKQTYANTAAREHLCKHSTQTRKQTQTNMAHHKQK
jgi:hypothetical protein